MKKKKCECQCDCDEIAVTTDDNGAPVCLGCADYLVDDDGEVYCARDPRVEVIHDRGRKIVRFYPPPEPPIDPDGEWACYWHTVGDDAHVVARYSTRELAQQAVDAKDWPPPWDHGRYLCGYEVRRKEEGKK